MSQPHESPAARAGQPAKKVDSVLAGISIFQCFRPQELEAIYQAGREQDYRPKTTILIEGENSRGLFVLLQGTVSIYKNDSEKGTLMRIATLESGAQFGELSLFEKAPRSATVAAETHCRMFVLEADRFEAFLAAGGNEMKMRFYRTCAEVLSVRLRKLNDDYIHAEQLLWKYALRKKSVS